MADTQNRYPITVHKQNNMPSQKPPTLCFLRHPIRLKRNYPFPQKQYTPFQEIRQSSPPLIKFAINS